MQFKKKKGGEECKDCQPQGMPVMPGMGGQVSNKEAMKHLKAMEKKRAKPMDCPFMPDCDFKMLPTVGQILCLDEEVGGRQGRGYMMHMAGQHAWAQCRQYAERLRKEKGVLPRDVKKALKALKRKK